MPTSYHKSDRGIRDAGRWVGFEKDSVGALFFAFGQFSHTEDNLKEAITVGKGQWKVIPGIRIGVPLHPKPNVLQRV